MLIFYKKFWGSISKPIFGINFVTFLEAGTNVISFFVRNLLILILS